MSQSVIAADIAAVRSGAKRIYIFGITHYGDVFRLRRKTRFGASVRADPQTLLSLTSNYGQADLAVNFDQADEFSEVSLRDTSAEEVGARIRLHSTLAPAATSVQL